MMVSTVCNLKLIKQATQIGSHTQCAWILEGTNTNVQSIEHCYVCVDRTVCEDFKTVVWAESSLKNEVNVVQLTVTQDDGAEGRVEEAAKEYTFSTLLNKPHHQFRASTTDQVQHQGSL